MESVNRHGEAQRLCLSLQEFVVSVAQAIACPWSRHGLETACMLMDENAKCLTGWVCNVIVLMISVVQQCRTLMLQLLPSSIVHSLT